MTLVATDTTASATATCGAELISVKWDNPTEELLSVARLADAFVQRLIADANQVCVATPNAAWAYQVARAFASIGAAADLRLPQRSLSAQARHGMAMLQLIAQPQNAELQASWLASGRTQAELDTLVQRYAQSGASTLLRVTGLADCPELEAALRHSCGDEKAPELFALLTEQLAHPTAPQGTHVISVMPYTELRDTYEQLFIVGCVDGLLPGPSANQDAEAADAEAARTAFHRALRLGTKRVFVSGFVKAPADLAAQANIRCLRTKMEGGTAMAMTRPTPFLAELESYRPSTLGGQALLRLYSLN